MGKKRQHSKARKTPFYIRYKPLLLRGMCFFGFAFFIIPLTIKALSKNLTTKIQLNFFSFLAYILAIIVFFVIFNRKILLSYKFKVNLNQMIIFSLSSFLLFIVYFYLKFLVTVKTAFSFLYTSLFAYFFGMVFLALAIFGTGFFKKVWFSLLVMLTTIYAYFMLAQIAWNNSHFFSENVTKAAYFVLGLFYKTVNLTIGNGDPKLILDDFSVIIGPPCSGIEGLGMFMGLFALLFFYDYENLNFKKTFVVFFFGLIGTYFINILRITLLMVIGTKYPRFSLGLFHSQAGWLLFSVYVLVLLYFTYSWMKGKEG